MENAGPSYESGKRAEHEKAGESGPKADNSAKRVLLLYKSVVIRYTGSCMHTARRRM
jgi:hypothetical protein